MRLLAAFLVLAVVTAAGETRGSLTLLSSANPSLPGRPVTVIANATPASAIGSVTFYDGTTVLGTRTLNSGTAAIRLAQLPSGRHALRAFFRGDITSATGLSAELDQTVSPVPASGFTTQASHLPGALFAAVADFNGDSKADLVTAGENGISVLLGNGDGSFQAPANYASGTSPAFIATGDFNGDGREDIAVANLRSDTVSILLGNGDGTFQAAVNYPAGSGPAAIALADFNGDGRVDLAVADSTGHDVAVLLGNGDGTFRAAVKYTTGEGPVALIAGDFNRDGKADLAVANRSAGTIGILTGNGDGAFAAAIEYSAGSEPQSIAVEDFNADGLPDLAIAGRQGVILLTGKADGSFDEPLILEAAVGASAVVAGDFNGDGKPDLAVLARGLIILYGNGDGAFQEPVAYGEGIAALSLATADFNADGRPDFALIDRNAIDILQALPFPWPETPTSSTTAPANIRSNPSSIGTADTTKPAAAPTWSPLNSPPAFDPDTNLLMTDGTVLVHEYCGSNWHKLTPDNTGSYINGTWSNTAPMPAAYGPLYASTAVLADGRLVVIGGEYNKADGCTAAVDTNLGAVYNPVTDTWVPLAAPAGWGGIGDAANVVLPDGQFLLAHIFDSQLARLDPSTLTWTKLTGSGKADSWNGEEGWTLLPDGTILTVDTNDGTMSERYFPATDSWSLAGSTGVNLVTGYETGPAVLRPDGTVFASGALGHTSVYSTAAGTWTPGPDFPMLNGQQLAVFDGPAALLPDGNVLVGANPLTVAAAGDSWAAPTRYFEFDGSNLNAVPAPAAAARTVSYFTRMLPLPNGQILMVEGDIQIYTPVGQANPAWAPTISSVASTITQAGTYTVTGTQFNGLSEAANYGDDVQQATNYPLVRIVNDATGHVFYCRTHDHSTMAVATGSTPVSTVFEVGMIELGASTLVVVANGIPSTPVAVTVTGPAPDLTIAATHSGGFAQGQMGALYTITATNSGLVATVGAVSVSDTLPPGMTAASIGGTGWTCTQPAGPCTRGDSLPSLTSYPTLTFAVNVGATATSPLTNTAAVSGGGEVYTGNDTASDVTIISKTATATALSTSASPSRLGRPVALTASVTPSSPTGAVTFYDGAAVLGTVTLSGSSATFIGSLLASGSHSLKAYYPGDATHMPSLSAVLTQQIGALGGSGFQPVVTYSGTDSAYFVGVSDFNGDGTPDLFSTGYGLAVRLGNGDGTFQTPLPASPGVLSDAHKTAAAADFNGDGKTDLVLPNYSAGTVSILPGNGDGTFQSALSSGTGSNSYPQAVAVADFNGDGKPDIATGNAFNTVSILLGNGDGTFQSPVTYPVDFNANAIMAGDFNGDGAADLAVVVNSSGNVSVLLGNGDGTFQPAVNYSVGSDPRSIALADFNGDGKPDLAVANYGSGNVSVLIGKGDGTFLAAVAYPSGANPTSVAAGDFDGDGKQDLAVAGYADDNVRVLTGNGDGTFQMPVSYPAGAPGNYVAAGDFNGDGSTDLAVYGAYGGIGILLGSAPPAQPVAAFLDQNGAPVLTFNGSTNFPDAGGFLIGPPGVAQTPNGDTFIVGLDGAGGVHLNSYSYANSTWNGWQYSGGILDTTSGLTAAVDPSGVVWFTGRDIGNRYWINSWNGTGFGGWILIADGIFSSDSIPQIAIPSDGTIYVVGKDIGGRIWSNSYNPVNQMFTGWVDRQAIMIGQPSITAGQDGFVYVAVRSVSSNSPVYITQIPAANGANANCAGCWWLNGGGLIDTDPLITSQGGTVYLMALAGNNTVYLLTFEEATQTYGRWSFTNGTLNDATIAAAGGSVFIAGRDTADRVYWYSVAGNSWFFADGAGISSTVLAGGK